MSTGVRPSRKKLLLPSHSPATWISARARNALRRPFFIGLVSLFTFGVALVALVVVPQQARRAADALRPGNSSRPDTESTVSAMSEAERQIAAAEAVLAGRRAEISQLVSATAAATSTDTTASGARVTTDVRTRRDSLTAQNELLSRLLARAENAPLLASYRALAQASPMQGDPRMKPMLDSLTEIERERESYTAVGGVDPVFVALTARVNELGRNIAALAEARRIAVRKELATLTPVSPAAQRIAARAIPDTLAAIAMRDTARIAANGVAVRLARERAELVALDAREAKAQELYGVGASPSAIVAAAAVFGAMLGFGIALGAEVRRPRIADAFEIERATGLKVLGIIKPLQATAERSRRASDKSGPRYLDSGGDGHQLVYLNIAAEGSNAVILTITGDNPAVSAVVAFNFAAIAADEARASILIDTDAETSSLTAALTIRATSGVAGIAQGTADWSDASRTVKLGRDKTIEVVPSGTTRLSTDQLKEVLERDALRLSRRYDAIVLVSALAQVEEGLASSLPVRDVVVCVRAGKTRLVSLTQMIDAVRASGATPRGVILWNAPDPALSATRPSEELQSAHLAAT